MKREEPAYLEQFARGIARYRTLMQEAWEGMLREDVSKYPVFIFHQEDVNVGIPLADRREIGGDWSIHLSTLEEFYIKGLVQVNQVDEIKGKIAGTPPAFCCLVIAEGQGSLVFIDQS